MSNLSKSFTATGDGGAIGIKHKDFIYYKVSGTFVATVQLQKSTAGGATWEVVSSHTTAATGTVLVENQGRSSAFYRFVCSAFTSGTVVTDLKEVVSGAVKIIISAVANGSNGVLSTDLTAGWELPSIAAGYGMAGLPASKSGSELIIGVSGIKVGSTITGYYLNGRVESGGLAASILVEPFKVLAAASSVTEADFDGSSLISLSVTADTLLSEANTLDVCSYTVKDNESLYFYIAGTTAAATAIYLQGITLLVVEP